MNREIIENIANELNEIADKDEYKFEGNYEGFQDDINVTALYILDAMFPSYSKFPESVGGDSDIRSHYLRVAGEKLTSALSKICSKEEAVSAAEELLSRVPKIYSILKTDIMAGYEGDPAAKSVDEIILAYPAFIAIGIYRIAHELYLMGYSVVARLMSEYAHRKTGIDIHPGAQIGKHFFIDHGTGVVIGETTVIGENVKLYQHVTLGAKSFPVGEDGALVKDIKRHPNIGNDVVVYAGATILGGDVFIGDGCVVGGNVWLTHSLKPGQKVFHEAK